MPGTNVAKPLSGRTMATMISGPSASRPAPTVTTAFMPTLRMRAPAPNDTRAKVPIRGSSPAPATSGSAPRIFCRYCGRYSSEAKKVADIRPMTMHALRNRPLPMTDGGTSPSSPARRSRRANATRSTTHSTRAPRTAGLVHPTFGAWPRATSSAIRPTDREAMPA